MDLKIFTISFGINNCYVIKQSSTAIMVDAGPPKIEKAFLKQTNKLGIDPEIIKLIVLTHGDFDHAGSAKTLKGLTGAKIAIHKNDQKTMEEGTFNWPPGASRWGRISRSIFYPLMKNNIKMDNVRADIVLDDQDYPLQEFGIDGDIIHTPGHTSGSVSVLLNSGDAFTGCLSHNRLPFSLKPRLPIYAENTEMIKESWSVLIKKGVKISYPGHGNPYHIEKILRYL
jgi:glyoxylase-like metal-dependent hydrolase (beta-lactamase superfamily II)